MRKKVIVYGTCQAQSLFAVLSCLPALTARYSLQLHFVGKQSTQWMTWKEDLARAELVVFQDCAAWATYPIHNIAEANRPMTIEFPGISMHFLWPFDAKVCGPDIVAEQLNPNRSWGLHYFDGLHARLRPYAEPGARYEMYLNLSDLGKPDLIAFYRRFDIERLRELETHRIQKLDERLGSSVGRYTLTHFRTRRLFHAAEHPTVEVTYRVAQEILQRLGISAFITVPLEDTNGSYQVPIHPRVASTLLLSWVTPDTTYRVYDSAYSFEQYHRRYIIDYG